MSWACGWTGEQVPGSCQAVRAAPGHSHGSGLRRRLASRTGRVSPGSPRLCRSLWSSQAERRAGRGHSGRPHPGQAARRQGDPHQHAVLVCQLPCSQDESRGWPMGVGMRHIAVASSRGILFALVSAEDHEFMASHSWRERKGYAATRVYVGRVNGRQKQRWTYMHRMLLGLSSEDRRQVDHVNRKRLDNRRHNLRIVPPGANAQNLPAYPSQNSAGISSGHRGVSWRQDRGKWWARVWHEGRHHSLGMYGDLETAARVASEYRARVMPFAVELGVGAV